jgi:hypothetical protein
MAARKVMTRARPRSCRKLILDRPPNVPNNSSSISNLVPAEVDLMDAGQLDADGMAIQFLDTPPPAPSVTVSRTCFQCGADWPDGAAACPDCEVRIVGIREAPSNLSRTFGIGTLMVVIAAVAVTFAIIRVEPVLGMVMGALLIVTLTRTLGGIARSRAVDWPLSLHDKISLGAESFGVAFLVVGGAAIAFFSAFIPLAVCAGPLASRRSSPADIVLMVLGVGIGLGAAVYVTRRIVKHLWPIRFH